MPMGFHLECASILSETLHRRRSARLAFIAALLHDPDGANWSAISDTFDDLSQESHGGASGKSIEALRHPIETKDARALVEAIGALLNTDERVTSS